MSDESTSSTTDGPSGPVGLDALARMCLQLDPVGMCHLLGYELPMRVEFIDSQLWTTQTRPDIVAILHFDSETPVAIVECQRVADANMGVRMFRNRDAVATQLAVQRAAEGPWTLILLHEVRLQARSKGAQQAARGALGIHTFWSIHSELTGSIGELPAKLRSLEHAGLLSLRRDLSAEQFHELEERVRKAPELNELTRRKHLFLLGEVGRVRFGISEDAMQDYEVQQTIEDLREAGVEVAEAERVYGYKYKVLFEQQRRERDELVDRKNDAKWAPRFRELDVWAAELGAQSAELASRSEDLAARAAELASRSEDLDARAAELDAWVAQFDAKFADLDAQSRTVTELMAKAEQLMKVAEALAGAADEPK